MQSNTLQKTSDISEDPEIQNTADSENQNPENISPDSESVSGKKSKKQKEKVPGNIIIRHVLWFLCGILWGATLMFIGGVLYLRHNLIQEIPLEGDFSSVAGSIGPVAQRYGWQTSYTQCGIPRQIEGQPMEVYRLCKSPYAYELLQTESERKISCMLPCAVSIYKKSDGVTYISKVNMPLVTQLLGGNSIGIFNEKIVPEQEAIMSHFATREEKKN